METDKSLPENPNILLIMTDQHRLSAVGAYGPTPCKTPNIDRLAQEGVRFENVYTTCPVCTPARASVITGQYPHSHGMTSNTEDLETSLHELEDRPTLLSRRLEKAGYQLGYTGKWHLGSSEPKLFSQTNRPCLPKDVGFKGHNFQGHGNGGWDFPQFKEYLRSRGLKHEVKPWSEPTPRVRADEQSAGELIQSVEGTVPYFLAENTISMIDEFASADSLKPFFIWHNFWGPHEPYRATKEYLDLYRDVEIPKWPNYDWPARQIPGPHQATITPVLAGDTNLTWEAWATYIRYYYAFTTLIDDQIGRIIEHLRNRGLLDNTVVIFAADHGASLGDHGGLFNKGWTHFEESLRIPLIIRMPDGTGSNSVSQELVSLVDFYPTILDLAGLDSESLPQGKHQPGRWPYECAHSVDGRSVLPLLCGEKSDWRDSVVIEFHGLMHTPYTMRTIRHGHFKYGYNFAATDELYNLKEDPHEMVNLISETAYAEILHDMRIRLRDWMIEMHDPTLYTYQYTVLRDCL